MLWDSQTLSGHGTNLKPDYRVAHHNRVVMGAPLEVLHGTPVVMLQPGADNVNLLSHHLIRHHQEEFEFLMPSYMLGLTFHS